MAQNTNEPNQMLPRLTSLLARLVSFRTVSADQQANREALAWVKAQLAHLPLHFTDFQDGGFHSLIATTRPAKRPKLLLLAHIDVVPGPDALFTMHRHNGKLLGRGVFDMKLALAVYIALLLELGDSLRDYDLGLMVTSDEEIGGAHGVGALVADGWTAGLGINPDSGSGWELEREAKGIVQFELISHGAAAHASRPWEGRAATDELLDCIAELRKLVLPEPCGDAQHWHDTLGVTMLQAGEAVNQLAVSAKAGIDLRFLPSRPLSEVLAGVTAIVARYPHLQLRLLQASGAFANNLADANLKLSKDIIGEVTGVDVPLILAHGASDSRYFAAQKVPFVLTRPAGGGAHGDDEWIEERGLGQLYEIVRRIAAAVAR